MAIYVRRFDPTLVCKLNLLPFQMLIDIGYAIPSSLFNDVTPVENAPKK